MTTFQPTIINWTWGTKEFVKANLGADVLLGQDQDNLAVRVWPLDWQAAIFVGSVDDYTREIRSTVPIDTATLERSVRHSVYARFDDSAETPIILLGQIQLVW